MCERQVPERYRARGVGVGWLLRLRLRRHRRRHGPVRPDRRTLTPSWTKLHTPFPVSPILDSQTPLYPTLELVFPGFVCMSVPPPPPLAAIGDVMNLCVPTVAGLFFATSRTLHEVGLTLLLGQAQVHHQPRRHRRCHLKRRLRPRV